MIKLRARDAATFGLVIALAVIFGLVNPRFFSAVNMNSLLLWFPMVLIVSLGQLPVIVTQGIDISVGSILGVSGIAVGLLFAQMPHLPLVIAFAAAAGVGALLGLVNGLLVDWGKIPAVVVTIGTLTAYRGLAFLISGGRQIDSSMLPDRLTNLPVEGIHFGGLTLSTLLLFSIIAAVLVWFALQFTQPGRDVYALGSRPHGAYLRGVNVRAINTLVYVFSGLTAGLAGAMYAARFGFVNPSTAGKDFELTVIAAVAIGGVQLTGGSGTVAGVIAGCLFLACLTVGLAVLGVNENWQMLVYGVVILGAVCIDYLFFKRKPGVGTA